MSRALQRFCSPICTQALSTIGVSGVRSPSARPASAVTGLKVEPVGYWPLVARLKRGEPASSPNSAS